MTLFFAFSIGSALIAAMFLIVGSCLLHQLMEYPEMVAWLVFALREGQSIVVSLVRENEHQGKLLLSE